MRFRRAWSAPAAPLRHIQGCCTAPASTTDGDVSGAADVLAIPAALYRLFPTQTSFDVHDVAFVPDVAIAAETSPPPPTSSAAPPVPSHDALTAELQAAKHQIALLTAASSQSFLRYATLETENARLRGCTTQLAEENESLKERLAQRDDEIGEQLHLICDLEKRLEEFTSLNVTNKSSWNGRNGD